MFCWKRAASSAVRVRAGARDSGSPGICCEAAGNAAARKTTTIVPRMDSFYRRGENWRHFLDSGRLKGYQERISEIGIQVTKNKSLFFNIAADGIRFFSRSPCALVDPLIF